MDFLVSLLSAIYSGWWNLQCATEFGKISPFRAISVLFCGCISFNLYENYDVGRHSWLWCISYLLQPWITSCM